MTACRVPAVLASLGFMPSPKIIKARLPLLCLAGLGMFATGACSDDTANEWPGNQTVHKRIAGLTDCTELQSEFDTAMRNLEREKAGTDRYTIVLSYAEPPKSAGKSWAVR